MGNGGGRWSVEQIHRHLFFCFFFLFFACAFFLWPCLVLFPRVLFFFEWNVFLIMSKEAHDSWVVYTFDMIVAMDL